jgi:hypothetical protein
MVLGITGSKVARAATMQAFAEFDGVVHERDGMIHISITRSTCPSDQYFDQQILRSK